MSDDCSHPAKDLSTDVYEGVHVIVVTVRCACGHQVSRTESPKLRPSPPGQGGPPLPRRK